MRSEAARLRAVLPDSEAASLGQARHQRQENAAGHHASKLSRGVGSHGVHQDEILEVLILSNARRQAPGHRKRADPRRADERVDLPAAQRGQQLPEEEAGHRIEGKSQEPEGQDEQGLGRRNEPAFVVEPTVIPRKSVAVFRISF